MKRVLLLAAVLAAPGVAWAQEYKPDFDCAKIPPNNGVAVMLCQNSDAAKQELIFDQTYYALRQKVGAEGWKSLKQEVILSENAMNQQCGLPIPGEENQEIPDQGAACYIEGMGKLTEQYKQRLSGSALEEANRDIDQHIALQQKLIDLGYLPSSAAADGVYGEGTRDAIETWQRVNHYPTADGFISNSAAGSLMRVNEDKQPIRQRASSPQPVRMQERSVEDVLADKDSLDGKEIIVTGRVYCINSLCEISQLSGASSINFSADNLDHNMKVTLLRCGTFEDTCVGRINGVISEGWLGTKIQVSKIEVQELPR